MQLTTPIVLMALTATSALAAAAPKEYPVCSEGDAQSFYGALTNELQQCKKTSKYDFAAAALPTPDQRSAVCKCKDLLEKIPYIEVPRCKIELDGNRFKFKDAITGIFSECGGLTVKERPPPTRAPGASKDGSVGGEAETPEPTTKPVPKSTNSTSAPVEENSKAGSTSGKGSSKGSSMGSSSADNTIEEPPTTAPVKETKSPKPSTTTATPVPSKSAASSVIVSSVAAIVVAAAANLA